VVGCGTGTGTVKGQVKFQDKPLPGGTIMFAPTDPKHNSVSAEIDENGNYELKDVPVGEYRVSVDNRSLQPPPPVGPPTELAKTELAKKFGKIAPTPKKEQPAEAGDKKSPGRYRDIPEKYYRTDTSKLTYTVTSGTQTKDFELK
jgi:hypothetical protein